ncbi:uncharacterized protein METZ01_LOCUS309319, partial [marine metagenome]
SIGCSVISIGFFNAINKIPEPRSLKVFS